MFETIQSTREQSENFLPSDPRKQRNKRPLPPPQQQNIKSKSSSSSSSTFIKTLHKIPEQSERKKRKLNPLPTKLMQPIPPNSRYNNHNMHPQKQQQMMMMQKKLKNILTTVIKEPNEFMSHPTPRH